MAGTAVDVPIGVAAARNLIDAIPDSIAVVRPRDTRLAAHFTDCGTARRAVHERGRRNECDTRVRYRRHRRRGWLDHRAWRHAVDRAGDDTRDCGGGGVRRDIAAPSYRGQRGHPVGFSRRHRDALASLIGDAGARSLIERNLDRMTWIDVDDAGVVRDVDTPSDVLAGR